MEAGRPPGNTGNTEANMAGWTLWWLAARLLARLVTDDLYGGLQHYPEPGERTTALASQAE